MGLMDRLFGKKDNQQEQQAPIENKRSNNINFQTLQRRDGTSINIMPVVDSMGNQTYEQVFNNATKQMQLMPKFIINSPELANIAKGDFTTVLMDINKDILNTPQGADWVANGLLSGQRLQKVFNEYGGYAGGLAMDQFGQITGKYIDPGIVNGLKMSKQQQWQEYQVEQTNRDKQATEQAIVTSQKYGVNIKTSHAEDLSIE